MSEDQLWVTKFKENIVNVQLLELTNKYSKEIFDF